MLPTGYEGKLLENLKTGEIDINGELCERRFYDIFDRVHFDLMLDTISIGWRGREILVFIKIHGDGEFGELFYEKTYPLANPGFEAPKEVIFEKVWENLNRAVEDCRKEFRYKKFNIKMTFLVRTRIRSGTLKESAYKAVPWRLQNRITPDDLFDYCKKNYIKTPSRKSIVKRKVGSLIGLSLNRCPTPALKEAFRRMSGFKPMLEVKTPSSISELHFD